LECGRVPAWRVRRRFIFRRTVNVKTRGSHVTEGALCATLASLVEFRECG
jgi:hypothetical protein